MDKDKRSKIRFLLGLSLILLGIIGLINYGYISQTFVIMFTFIFGLPAYWIFMPCLIFSGVFIIAYRNKVYPKLYKNISFIGLVFLTFGLMILITASSNYGLVDANGEAVEAIGFQNFASKFWNSWLNATKDPVVYTKPYLHFNPLYSQLGGGFIGYFFTSLLNLLTPIGCIVSSSIITLIGFVLIIFIPIKTIVDKRRKYNKKQEQLDDAVVNTNTVSENTAPITTAANIEDESTLERIDNTPKSNIEQSPTINNDNEVEAKPLNTDENDEDEIVKAQYVINQRDVERIGNNSSTIFSPKGEDNSLITPLIFDDDKEVETETAIIENNEKEEVISNKTEELKPIEKINNQPEVKKEKKPYVLPSIDLLNDAHNDDVLSMNEEQSKINADIIEKTFVSFKVGAHVVGYTIGPRITRFDIQMDSDSSIQSIPKYIDDISQRLNGVPARFEAVVPGKMTSGLEIPNVKSITIPFKEIIQVIPSEKNKLYIPFGKNISGEIKFANLAKFPHMLIAGTTGSGKSVYVNSVIMSLMYRLTPDELKFILIDPKFVEFAKYEKSPYLVCPVISDPMKAYNALKKVSTEMDKRYALFSEMKVNNIITYNEKAPSLNKETIPYIVVIVDEFADLMQTCKKVDQEINRIAAKARAAGIHLIIATQRPSVDVITGTIKSNLGVRVSLHVPDVESSKTILGTIGAEKLLDNGDMLITCPEVQYNGHPRLQACLIMDNEVEKIIDFINSQREPEYFSDFLNLEEQEVQPEESKKISSADAKAMEDDELYNFVKEGLKTRQYISISMIERENGIGFNRAGRLLTRLQNEGVVSRDTEPGKGCKVIKEKLGNGNTAI